MLPALPNEIWIQIFEALIDLGPVIDEESLMISCRRKSPNVISWTCSTWRQIALSTPTLWTQIVVPYESFKFVNDCGLDEIKTWVERSRSAPLDINFAWWHDKQGASLEYLLAHADRWRSFEGCTYVDDWEKTRPIFNWLCDIIPRNIQRIHLHNVGECTWEGVRFFGGAKTTFSKLTDLVVNQVPIDWNDHPFATPSLKKLRLCLGSLVDVVPLPNFVALLNGCPGLEELMMYGKCVDFRGITECLHLQHSVSLPNLHTISTELYRNDLHSTSNILRLLREPTVKVLELWGNGWGCEREWEADQYALEASSAVLGAVKQIRILEFYVDEDKGGVASLSAFLEKATGLQELEFTSRLLPVDEPEGELVYGPLFGLLRSDLCPELQSLGVPTIPKESARRLMEERPRIQTYLLPK